MPRLRPAVLLLALCACRSTPPPALDVPAPLPAAPAAEAQPDAPQAPAAPRAVELPQGWAGVPLERFGALLEQLFPAGERRTLVPSAFEELSSALRGDDPIALRALELLARCSDP